MFVGFFLYNDMYRDDEFIKIKFAIPRYHRIDKVQRGLVNIHRNILSSNFTVLDLISLGATPGLPPI